MNQSPIFRLLIIYENFSAGVQSIVSMDPMLRHLKPQFEVQTRLWSFDEFEHFPQLIERATHEAVEADIIVVSAQSEAGLPARIHQWIEHWAALKHGNHSAIVALVGLGNAIRQKASLRAFLKRVAKGCGMAFFCGTVLSSVETLDGTMPTLAGQSKEDFEPALAGSPGTFGLRENRFWNQ
jgi:hypothetical protein